MYATLLCDCLINHHLLFNGTRVRILSKLYLFTIGRVFYRVCVLCIDSLLVHVFIYLVPQYNNPFKIIVSYM